jgi:hypothetical protein
MRTASLVLSMVSLAAGMPAPPRTPLPVFTTVGFSADEVAAVDAGRPVAKVLAWGAKSEIHVFGAVHVTGSADVYLKSARDLRSLATASGYLGIGELSAASTADDLRGLTLDQDDVKALKNCREGDCDMQLPTRSIAAFREQVDWSRPDAANQVNTLTRSMILRLVRAYDSGGNSALGEYRDKEHPARVAEQFATMVSRTDALPNVLPELRKYLLDYPTATLPDADSFYYWEHVDFGLKPTVRVNHGVIYHVVAGGHTAGVVAIKQLYASHYFHTALDVTACVDDGTGSDGFYLLTLKASEQEGLTGFKGSMLRRIVVDKTRSALQDTLATIKQRIEARAQAH